MIWQLVKRGPAWRNALIWIALGAAAGTVLTPQLIGIFGFVVGMFCLQNQPQRRATLFQAALPIPARDLFLARILSLFSAVWLPLASGAATIMLVRKSAEDAATLIEMGAAYSVLVLVAQSSRVREIAGSRWTSGIAVAVVWAAAWPISLSVPRAAVLAVCAVLCPVLFWNIWRQLPLAFEVLPATLASPRAARATALPPVFVWVPLLRSLFAVSTFGFLPMLVFMPLSGQWLLVSMFCIFPVIAAIPRAPWALGLPVRRDALLAVILLPWLMALLLGVLAGNRFGERPLIDMERSASHRVPGVRPPLEFWRTGKAPVIESPWGESWQPETVNLHGVAIYNPYSAGPGASDRFFDWQFRRATEAVYGQEIDYAYYSSHRIGVRPGVLPLMRQTRFAILNLAACACWTMLLVNLLLTSMHWRVCRLSQRGQTAVSWLIMTQMMILLLMDLAPGDQAFVHVGTSLVNALLLRLSALLPASLPALALATAIPLAMLWWTAVHLFNGVELPPPPAAARA